MTYNLSLYGNFTRRALFMAFRILAVSFLALGLMAGGMAYAGSETAAPADGAAAAPKSGGSSVSLDELIEMKDKAEDELPGQGLQEGRMGAPAEPQLLDEAQNVGSGKKSKRPHAPNEVDDFSSGAPIDIVEMKYSESDEYIDPNRQNMSKLMWQMGILDLSDNVAIDNYLLINECELYLRFYNNDIEWEKIREATREHLNNNMMKFSTKFEILVPISLNRYNPEKQYFELEEESKMINVRRLDINMNNRRQACNEKGKEIRGYPRNIILTLNRPFSFTRVPVSKALAELYIEEARIQYENVPLKLQNEYYERMAFLRAKVNITSFKEAIQGRHGEMQAVVIGQLDGVEIYADVEKQKLMYRENRKNKSIRQRRKEQAQAESFGAAAPENQPKAEAAKAPDEPEPLKKNMTPFSRKNPNFAEEKPVAPPRGSAISGGSASDMPQ